MDKHQVNLILEIVDLALKYGIPVIQEILNNMEKEVITRQDVENLRIDMEWQNYFE